MHPPSRTFQALAGHFREMLERRILARWVYRTEGLPTRCEADPAYAEQIADWTLANSRLARAVAREGGTDFYAVLQPIAQVGAARIEHLSDPIGEADDLSAVYQALRRRIVLADNGWMLDWTDAYDGDAYIYVDSCHASRAGHEIIAERLQRLLEPALEARRAEAALRDQASLRM